MNDINNITKHAAFRYMQRVKKDNEILTEAQFNNFVKLNPEKFEEIKKIMFEEIDQLKLDFLGEYKIRNNEKSNVYLDQEKRIIYIVKDKNLVTCYKLNFVNCEESNEQIFKAFMRDIFINKNKKNNLITTIEQENIKNNNSITEIELKLKKLKQEMNKLEEEKKELLNNVSNKKTELEIIDEEIKLSIQKMLNI